MPGQIPNTNILKAIDQVIKALNDLAANFGAPNSTTIEENTGRIGDEIVNLNTTLETRSIAATEAQNTNFTGLVAAINGLSLTCAPIVNVRSATPTINVSCCGSGSLGNGPVIPPDPAPGQPSPGVPDPNDPPANYPPNPIHPYDEYKCRAANFLVDAYLDYINTVVNNFWTIAFKGTISFGTITSLLFGASPFLAIIAPAAVPVLVGYVIALVVGSLITSFALGAYYGYLVEHKQEWVCDLYNAQDVTAARNIIIEWLSTGSDLPGDWVSYHVDNLFPNSVLNILFEEYEPAANYSGSVDCNTCGCQPLSFDYGSWDGEWLFTPTFEGVIAGCEHHTLYFAMSCPAELSFSLASGILDKSCQDPPLVTDMVRLYSGGPNGTEVYSGNSLPSGAVCCDYLRIFSLEPFTLQIEKVSDC